MTRKGSEVRVLYGPPVGTRTAGRLQGVWEQFGSNSVGVRLTPCEHRSHGPTARRYDARALLTGMRAAGHRLRSAECSVALETCHLWVESDHVVDFGTKSLFDSQARFRDAGRGCSSRF